MDQAFVQWLMADEFSLEVTSPDLPPWYADAACRDADTDLWFPEKGDDWRPGVRVCDECPVRRQCLDHALEHDERDGIWGGLTAGQRADVSRREAA